MSSASAAIRNIFQSEVLKPGGTVVSSGLSAAKDGWVRICGAGTEHCPKRVPMPDMMAGLKALTQA